MRSGVETGPYPSAHTASFHWVHAYPASTYVGSSVQRKGGGEAGGSSGSGGLEGGRSGAGGGAEGGSSRATNVVTVRSMVGAASEPAPSLTLHCSGTSMSKVSMSSFRFSMRMTAGGSGAGLAGSYV